MKQIQGIYSPPKGHWVGNGFPVQSLFDYQGLGQQLSPFLLLDYAAPTEFSPSQTPRGVGPHPHRGFETVTIVYDGEVAHRDSTGKGGLIGPGDVQWMTAGSGLLHEEFHSEAFTRRGGRLHMVQLWVNLPAKHKMTPPAYQAILSASIPVIALANQTGSEAGLARVIAGSFGTVTGPASTFSPLQVLDLTLHQGQSLDLPLHVGWHTALVVLQGQLRLNGSHLVQTSELAVLSQEGEHLQLTTEVDTQVLLLSGEPLNEPIVGYGPFVMNSAQEIQEAIASFQNGEFGSLQSANSSLS
jgi:redox-sensitive bicupin YhaK (pirin superfamily)